MTLTVVLFDRAALITHGNWNEPLCQLLLELYKYNTAVIDISAEQSCFHYDPADCLLIADCEETIQWAEEYDLAILGYEPEGKERNITSRLPLIVEGFEEVDFYFLERVYQRYHNLPWTAVETARCILREITPEDLEDLYELYSPPEMTHYMEGLHEKREDEETYTRAYIENIYRFYGYGLWVVIEKETGRLIGRAGVEQRQEEGELLLELGYCIAVDKQREGFATEVCLGVLDYAKEALDFDRVYCFIQRENTVSVHLAEKLGFRWERSVIQNEKEMQRYVKFLQT